MSDKLVNLEDKIIAYLDGTLDETSRAELLHTLSVSPEKRKLLEEHIKLREIISLGHKPASVPLMTERKLAGRIPVLMQELPYLAEKSNRIAPIIPVSSTSYFTLLGRQVSSFFTSRFGQAVSLGTLALIGGMTWYMSQTNDDASIEASAPVASQYQSGSVNAPKVGSSETTGVDGSSNSSIIDPSAKDASSRSHLVSTSSSNATSSRAKIKDQPYTRSIDQWSLIDRGSRSTTQESGPSEMKLSDQSQASEPSTKDDSSPIDNDTVAKSNDSERTEAKSNEITNNDAQKPNDIKDPKDLPPLPLPSNERNVTGRFVAQADYSGSFTVRPNVKAQEYETTSGIGAPVIGLGYEFSSKWAIGVEAGKSSLSQQQQERIETPVQFTPGPAGNQISVSDRVTYTTDVKNVDALWGLAILRYTVNPNSLFRLEVSGGAGIASANGVAPMVSLGSAVTYDISEVFAITGGVTARGAWLNGLNAEDEETNTTLGGGNARAVVSHRPETNELFSSSIAGRIGIRVGLF